MTFEAGVVAASTIMVEAGVVAGGMGVDEDGDEPQAPRPPISSKPHDRNPEGMENHIRRF